MTQVEYNKAVQLYMKARELEQVNNVLLASSFNAATVSIAGIDTVSGNYVGGTVDAVNMYSDIRTALLNRKTTLENDIAQLKTDIDGNSITP